MATAIGIIVFICAAIWGHKLLKEVDQALHSMREYGE